MKRFFQPFAFFCAIIATSLAANPEPNILFIGVDDLRREIGAYGVERAITPNLDRLAETGTRFDQAYCQVPVCGASRASMMTSLYPNSKRFRSFNSRADVDVPEIVTLPAHFKNHGYDTHAVGKLFHAIQDNLETAWSHEPYYLGRLRVGDEWVYQGWVDYLLEENNRGNTKTHTPGSPFEAADVGDHSYRDGKYTLNAIKYLEEQTYGDKPFFLALGYVKPHLPFNAPKHYWDLFDVNEIELPPNFILPEGVPHIFMNEESVELFSYQDIPQGEPIGSDLARQLIHGYLACVAYIDRQIGLVMQTLEEQGLMENTIVVVWADHGFFLGDNTQWGKGSVMDQAIRVPLIVHHPDLPSRVSDDIVELVDLYPTLCELAGLPIPQHVQGDSLKPILKGETVAPDYAYSKYWGDSIRMGNYHYMRTRDLKHRALFDVEKNPIQTRNLVDEDAYVEIVEQLEALLAERIESNEQDTM